MPRIVGLGGGIGASRLWSALARAVPQQDLTLIVNTADDLWMYGVRVCPDLDTTVYALAGRQDTKRGWGLAGETWRTMDMLRGLGGDVWFNLGDRDLATHLYRTGRLRGGAGLSVVTSELAASMGVGAEQARRWHCAAEKIHADVCARAVDERGVFTQHYDTKALDASVLLLALLGFLPPDDDRIRATVLAIADELTDAGLVLRYRTEETDDGLRGEEGAFITCSFWLVSALVLIGEVQRARVLCERLLSQASELGRYAEELDPRTGLHLGNFPQALTHVALINAVVSIIDAEQGRPTAQHTMLGADSGRIHMPSGKAPPWL